jgi:hypothetical protein
MPSYEPVKSLPAGPSIELISVRARSSTRLGVQPTMLETGRLLSGDHDV